MLDSKIQPDAQLYVPLLLGCTKTLSLQKGEQVHNQIINNKITIDTTLGNALINMYSKCGNTAKVMDIFYQMERTGTRDAVTWTLIIQLVDNINEGERIYTQLQVKINS